MIRLVAQHVANNPGIAQHLANNLGGEAPLRLHHTVHLLQHGVHGGWLTFVLFLLIIGLPFIIALAGIIYRRTQRGSAPSVSAYRPVTVGPWQSGVSTPPTTAPWQSGIASSATPAYSQPAYVPAPTASVAPTAAAWSAPQANLWAAPSPQWTG